MGGNVGIGTGHPNAALTVVGNISSTGDQYINGALNINNLVTNGNIFAAGNLGLSGNSTVIGYQTVTGMISGGNGIYVQSPSGVPVATFMGGKVGIGNTHPVYPLDVVGDINANGNLRVTGNFYVSGGIITNTTAVLSSQGLDIINNGTRTTLNLTQTGPYPVIVATVNSNTAFYVDGSTSGYVGIGTSKPNANLTVAGNISAQSNIFTPVLSTSYVYLTNGIANDGLAPVLFIGEYGTGTYAMSGFITSYDELQNKYYISSVFGNTPSITAFAIDQNANVGINTSTPNATLTVNGQISGNKSISIGTNNNTNISGYANILGGVNNTASANYSSVVGGKNNTASACYTVITGGYNNTATGNYSVVAGGISNNVTANCSSITGGSSNQVACTFSSVVGGRCNNVCNCYSNITGGQYNTTSGAYSNIGGGYCNNATCTAASVLGGQFNNACNFASTVIGGSCNTASGRYSTVAGGSCNTTNGLVSFVAAGSANNTNNQANTFILGSNITAGQPNFTYVNNISSCGYVYGNYIGNGSNLTGVLASGSFFTTGTSLSSLRYVYGGNCACANFSSVFGGQNNLITSAGVDSSITGGAGNLISACYSHIDGGLNNTASGVYSSVGGGICNTASGRASTIAGGGNNQAGYESTVGGGAGNIANGNISTVAGGNSNTASGIYSTVAGGAINTASGSWSTVAGGSSNIASGNCSAILGGVSNNTNNQTNTFILGSNITATQPNFTYVNNLSTTGNIYTNNVVISGSVNVLGDLTNVSRAVVNGSVRNIIVGNGGSGYVTPPSVTIDAPTDIIGNNIQATAVANIAGGVVTSITVTNAGKGYLQHPNVTISGGSGSGAIAYALADYSALPNKYGRGGQTSAVLYWDGRMFSAGRSYYGTIPMGYYADIYSYTPVSVTPTDSATPYGRPVEYWQAGLSLYVLDSNGVLWASGYNNYGNLGNGSTEHETFMNKVYFGGQEGNINPKRAVVKFAVNESEDQAAYITCIAMTADGTIWTWGYNGYGQLGIGSTDGSAHPTPIPISLTNSSGIKQILNTGDSSNSQSLFILFNNGQVQGCGWTNYGELGRGSSGYGSYIPTFGNVMSGVNLPIGNVKAVYGSNGGVSGTGATYFLCNDGTLWSTGYNGIGALGLGDTTNRNYATKITSLSNIVKFETFSLIGDHTACYALDGYGQLWSWGRNTWGELGIGTTDGAAHPTPVPMHNPVYPTYRTGVAAVPNWSWSSGLVKDFTAADGAFALLTNDGRVFTCGYNGWGGLAFDSEQPYVTTLTQVKLPKQNAQSIAIVGYSNQIFLQIITQEGRVYMCGMNNYGQLGLGNANSWYYVPTETYQL
jgi:alpha-tubulin suppressor-like RCC1 family protein